MDSKLRNFYGNGDLKVFIEKTALHSALKGYEDEKTAQNLASRLEGRAFDVYMRLSATDKKDVDKVQTEFMNEFELSNQDREMAMYEWTTRRRKQGESPQTFIYKIMELVKLAYPSFDHANQETIAKDYYMKGIHPKMQITLKAMPTFSESSFNDIATETIRLQLAGIESFSVSEPNQCNNVNNGNNDSLVDSIAEKVVSMMTELSLGAEASRDVNHELPNTNFVGNRFRRNQRGTRGNQSSAHNRNFSNRGYQQNNAPAHTPQNKKCRVCQSSEHFVRDCPTRFCQACGKRGHDAWHKSCPNFQ